MYKKNKEMNIDEILGLDSKAYDSNYNDYQNWKCITPLQAKQAIKEIVEGVLQMAVENADVVDIRTVNGNGEISEYYVVDKKSILNVINKINF